VERRHVRAALVHEEPVNVWMVATSRGDRTVREEAQRLLGLTDNEADVLFDAEWAPRSGMTVPEALRLLADGVFLSEVTSEWLLAYRPVAIERLLAEEAEA